MSPAILTTSQLLTTGVDAPTCKNVVLARVVGSMTEFKQIIGRGTRVREDYGKLFFNILDYTGSATRLFADPDFDGEPALIDEEVMDADGEVVEQTVVEDESQGDEDGAVEASSSSSPSTSRPSSASSTSTAGRSRSPRRSSTNSTRRASSSGSSATRTTRATRCKALYRSPEELEGDWREPRAAARDHRARSRSAGLSCDDLGEVAGSRTPTRSTCCATSPSMRRCAPAASARSGLPRDQQGLLRAVRPRGTGDPRGARRQVRRARLDQLRLPDVLKVPPISERGNPSEIASVFGGPEQLREAVDELEELLYAA